MKDQQRIVQLWPGAPVETGAFTHLELTFDLLDDKVTTSTAAKDITGEPYYKHILDTKADSSISFTGTDVTSYRPPTNQAEAIASIPSVATQPSNTMAAHEPYAETYKTGYEWKKEGETTWTQANPSTTTDPWTQYQGETYSGDTAW